MKAKIIKELNFGDYSGTEIKMISPDRFLYQCETDEGLGVHEQEVDKKFIIEKLSEEKDRILDELLDIHNFLKEIQLI